MRFAFALAFALYSWACTAPISVENEPNPMVKLSAFKTFQWSPTSYVHPVHDRLIREEINSRLQEKGFLLTTNHPDFFVAYSVVQQDKEAPMRPMKPLFETEPLDEQTRVYTEESLTIELLNGAQNYVLWRGIAATEVPMVPSREKSNVTLKKTVAKIFDDFPPK